jgi:hypothetical protein
MIYPVLSEISVEKKIEALKKLRDQDLQVLYSMASVLVNSIYAIEFNLQLDEYGKAVKSFLDGYRRNIPGPTTEDKFLKAMFYELVPLLYHAERECGLSLTRCFSATDFYCFFTDFLNSTVKGLPESREVDMKTYELKKYPKTRVDLDEADQVEIGTSSDDAFLIVKACVFKVNRLNVLCGFFSESGSWRSEKYVNREHLQHISVKYNLVLRRTDN